MDNDEVTVKLSHPTGAAIAFSESLIKYLVEHRSATGRFAVGDWLESLADTDLASFMKLATQFCKGSDQHDVDDVMGVAIHAATAEKRVKRLSLAPDKMFELAGLLLHAAALECNRRQEYVVVTGKIRMYPFPKDTVTLTDKGIAKGQWYGSLH